MPCLEQNITPPEIYDVPCRHPAPVNSFRNMHISSPSACYPVFDIVFQEMKYGSHEKIIERREDEGIPLVFHYRIVRYERTVILALVFGDVFFPYPVVTFLYFHDFIFCRIMDLRLGYLQLRELFLPIVYNQLTLFFCCVMVDDD